MMRFFKIGVVMGVFSLFLTLVVTEEKVNSDQQDSRSVSYETSHEADTIRIGPHYVEMPIGRILLIRNGRSYGAVKFTRFWKGRRKNEKYALYECWYRDKGPGSFLENGVKFQTGKASTSLYGIGRFSFNFGNEEVRCGIFRLWWWGDGTVYFFGRGQEFRDHGIEFAPTKWTSIEQVDVFDHRLYWYRYDKDRPRLDIAVDKLW
jgi:hypothetical protein